MCVQTRAMTEADAPPVSQIIGACYRKMAEREGFGQEQLARLLAEHSTEGIVREGWLRQWECHVAESGTRVVGALAIEGNDVAELWVSPKYQRKGIGSVSKMAIVPVGNCLSLFSRRSRYTFEATIA